MRHNGATNDRSAAATRLREFACLGGEVDRVGASAALRVDLGERDARGDAGGIFAEHALEYPLAARCSERQYKGQRPTLATLLPRRSEYPVGISYRRVACAANLEPLVADLDEKEALRVSPTPESAKDANPRIRFQLTR
jgi:hypothetical protein